MDLSCETQIRLGGPNSLLMICLEPTDGVYVRRRVHVALPNVGPMNRSLWVIHKGKSHRSCTEDISLPFLWGVAPCFMGCTTKASLNFQILERTIF